MPTKTNAIIARHNIAIYFRDELKHVRDNDRRPSSYSIYYFESNDNWLSRTKAYLTKWAAVMDVDAAQQWIDFVDNYDYTEIVNVYNRLAQGVLNTYWGAMLKASLTHDWYPGMKTTYTDLAKYQTFAFNMEDKLFQVWVHEEVNQNVNE